MKSLVERASEAEQWFSNVGADWRRDFLHAVADGIESRSDELAVVTIDETGLERKRVLGEIDRTTSQLRFIGDVGAEGSWRSLSLDRLADGSTLARGQMAIGAVAVFAASNFPLAFGVIGCDTAAAWASGCPVVAKAHPLQPRTSTLQEEIVVKVLRDLAAPSGLFGLVHGMEAGRELVLAPAISAVAFTGSTAGGLALQELAAKRQRPIPVFAEMGSLNPMVISATVLRDAPESLAAGFVGSVTGSAGQLCTKPGLLLVPEDRRLELTELVSDRMSDLPLPQMLSSHMAWSWVAGMRQRLEMSDTGSWSGCSPIVASVTAVQVLTDPLLREECFGPGSVIAGFRHPSEVVAVLDAVGGSLAGGMHADESEDAELIGQILPSLLRACGRIVWNSWPTGVAVNWSTHHGGPWPATTDHTRTSVGAASIERFIRPVAVQNFPEHLVPEQIRSQAAEGPPIRINGRFQHLMNVKQTNAKEPNS